MILKNDSFKINLQIKDYTEDLLINEKLEYIYNKNIYSTENCKVIVIEVTSSIKTLKIGLLCNYDIEEQYHALLENNILTILHYDSISKININTGELIINKKMDSCGIGLNIYKLNEDYIIHGELEIIMLDSNLNEKWKFSGKDIFVCQSDKKAFELSDRCIKLYDFMDNYYELDFEGNQVN